MHGNRTQFISMSQKQIFPPPLLSLLVSLLSNAPLFVCVSPRRDNKISFLLLD